MKNILLILGCSLALTGCFATKGVKTIGIFHEFTGHWVGSGKVYSGPNHAEEDWTSSVSYKGVYDNVIVQKNEIIEVGTSKPIATLSFLAWDWENNNPVLMSVGNDGKGEGIAEERWHADLNFDKDHCLKQVLVGESKESSYALYIKFTKVPAFEPTQDLKIIR